MDVNKRTSYLYLPLLFLANSIGHTTVFNGPVRKRNTVYINITYQIQIHFSNQATSENIPLWHVVICEGIQFPMFFLCSEVLW